MLNRLNIVKTITDRGRIHWSVLTATRYASLGVPTCLYLPGESGSTFWDHVNCWDKAHSNSEFARKEGVVAHNLYLAFTPTGYRRYALEDPNIKVVVIGGLDKMSSECDYSEILDDISNADKLVFMTVDADRLNEITYGDARLADWADSVVEIQKQG